MERTYIAIDLKSFYASVECVKREQDPLTTNLVVADESRTEKTICLAVSPSLKAYGIPGRARLWEVIGKVQEVNRMRLVSAPGHRFTGKSSNAYDLADDPGLELDFIIAPPAMSHYMEVSTQIYQVYLKYIAPEDIHVYSIDEVFLDATAYLSTYHMTGRELAMTMIREVLRVSGVTATAGIGTNLYLSKIAMDIVAKKMPPDQDGVRIAELNEHSYRELLWEHRPLTDFWRIGRGYAKKLEANQMYTMGDVARCSLVDEDRLYKLFGINAELLIDHAWGWEPCTMADIKAYRPELHSLSSGQVLSSPYPFDKARLIMREMTDQLSLSLVEHGLVTDALTLTVNYDTESLAGGTYNGPIATDFYGRQVPKQAHGTVRLKAPTASTMLLLEKMTELYDRIVNPNLLVRRITVAANNVVPECEAVMTPVQYDLFSDPAEQERRHAEEAQAREREKRMQKALLTIKNRYGKNAILKGMNYEEGATTRERNAQVGGHKA